MSNCCKMRHSRALDLTLELTAKEIFPLLGVLMRARQSIKKIPENEREIEIASKLIKQLSASIIKASNHE